MQTSPDILVNPDGLIRAPKEAAGKERGEKHDAVVPLRAGTGETQLIEKPMDIEEGRGELVENESRAVKIYEGALEGKGSVSCAYSHENTTAPNVYLMLHAHFFLDEKHRVVERK